MISLGFNYYNYGNIRNCRITSGKIQVKDPFDRITEYATPLQEETDWQCNLFISPYIAFVLYTHDKREIIGRFDGSITVYRDDLMVGLNSWQPKKAVDVRPIGYYSGASSLQHILLDYTDRKNLFVSSLRYEALLPTPLYGEPNLTTALAIMEQRERNSIILLEGGGEVEVPVWSIQNTLRIGTCRDFV